MDDIVKKALEKWPNVPDCYGWLALDQRGKWYMRDDRIQAQGYFPKSKGSWLQHEKLIEFIGRNYQSDNWGRWYFQNGPQKVFVELESAPWVIRIHQQEKQFDRSEFHFSTHTKIAIAPKAIYQDENGLVYVESEHGLGVVDSQDMLALANALEFYQWTITELVAASLETRFHFLKSPQLNYNTSKEK